MSTRAFDDLLENIYACTRCPDLPCGPRPVLQASQRAPILIAAQAPGIRVHETGIPFNDPSGDRLREWLGVSRETFYDPACFCIIPMGFCYPGTGKSGDLPPRSTCRETWHDALYTHLPQLRLRLVIGQYAHAYHLGEHRQRTLTETVRNWQAYGETILPLPHPSPRNNIWLKRNPWFEEELLPVLKTRVQRLLTQSSSG